MFEKAEHIGIAVKNISQSVKLFEILLNSPCYKTEVVESENVTTAFFKAGESKIELLEASSEESAIAKFIEKRGEGLHHIAFEVENIEEEMARLKEKGFQLLRDKPFRGADNKMVCFIHPKSCNGVLIELCQEIK
jgi:methylmalonyl-CoA/ethylmalonyl-CoA epimerase